MGMTKIEMENAIFSLYLLILDKVVKISPKHIDLKSFDTKFSYIFKFYFTYI